MCVKAIASQILDIFETLYIYGLNIIV